MLNQKRFRLRIIIPVFPSFNIYSAIARSTTALGPICVATSCHKLTDWDVEVIDENNCQSHLCPRDENGAIDHQTLQKMRPADVVGFYGSLSSTIPRLYHLAYQYQQMGAKTVAGGKHPESLPQEALNNNIDVVVFGDGEAAMPEILSAWQNNQPLEAIAGIAFLKDGQFFETAKRPLIADFEKMPYPNFNLLHYAKVSVYPISWWRGCPYNCEFCAVKDDTRFASVERLVAIIAHLVETRDARKFFIVDDHFGGNHENEKERQDAIRFCELISEYQKKIGRRLSFTVQIRLTAAKRPELLKAMRQAGVNHVCIGYESPIDKELASMRKGYLAKDMVAWTKIFHRFGFFIHGMFIFGYPRKKDQPASGLSLAETAKQFKKFIRQSKIDTLQILLTTPLPGTELYKRLQEDGRLYPLAQLGWEYYDGQFPLFEPDDGLAPEKLQDAANKIMRDFYRFSYLWKIILNVVFHFPRVVFPAAVTIIAWRVSFLKSAFGRWQKKHFRNDLVRFGGFIIARKWLKDFKKSDFMERLNQAKNQLRQKQL